MAAISATFNCVAVDYYGRTITGPFKLVGELMYSDRQVGGGPMPPGGAPPDLGIWPSPPEGIAPHPEHPWVPPGKPSVPPPSVWPNPPEGTAPLPEHPIVLPDPGVPLPPGTLITWKAVWSEENGWQVVGVPNVPHPSPS